MSSFYDPYNYNGYPAVRGLLRFIQTLENGAADGTGIKKLVDNAHNLVGMDIPDIIVSYAVSVQNNLFGDYPKPSDLAPSIVFAVLFGVLGLFHLLIFSINYSRGHYFWISLVWFLNCSTKMIGFALRAAWSQNLTRTGVGLTSEIFLIITAVIFASFDLILAQRLFTWRHPVGGSRKLFWGIMLSMYAIVIILVIVTVIGAFVPYLHYLSKDLYEAWKIVVMVTSVFVLTYSLTSMCLIGLSYLFPPTTKDENLYTYQPWWIESFSPFYFVQPGAAQKSEETFMKRNHNHRHAIRVIAATHHHYNMVEGLTNQRGNLKHNVSLCLIMATTVLIFVGSLLRCITIFQNNTAYNLSLLCQPYVMYICWGAFEVIINILYIVGRVDLRFYRPDILPAKVRAIITAEQSHYVSDNEEENKEEDIMNTPCSGLFSSVDHKSFDFMNTGAKTPEHPGSHSPQLQSPPYPRDEYHEKVEHDDNMSDFHF